VVEIHLLAMAQYVAAVERRKVPAILVDYDPGSAWAAELARTSNGLRRLSRKVEVMAWRRYERATRPSFDAIVVFAERDVHAVAPDAGRARVLRVPLAVEVPPRAYDAAGSDPPTILFVGGFSHPPNVDAAIWLAKSLFPRVVERVPDARLEIVGHEPGDEVRGLATESVSVHASVPDVGPYLERAAVVAAPIRIGGSMRMKVLEALAGGKAVVATPRAAEGLEHLAGEQLVLAGDERAFVDALVELLLHPQQRRALGERARHWAEESLGWTDGVATFERLYESLALPHRVDDVDDTGRG
jgi:polysaccharide biosynthesis protein PslH